MSGGLNRIVLIVIRVLQYAAGFGWVFLLVLGLLLLLLAKRKRLGVVFTVIALVWGGMFVVQDCFYAREYNRVKTNFASVRQGMTQDEVKALLGEPQSTFAPGSGFLSSGPNRLWAYYRKRSLAYPTSDFPFWKVKKLDFLSRLFGPLSSDYQVAFDPQKNVVIHTRPPGE